MLSITNISGKTLKFDDLGNTLIYGVDRVLSQNTDLPPNKTINFIITKKVKNSYLMGDIRKFSNNGWITITGNCLELKQCLVQGVAQGQALGLLDVVEVVSILSFDNTGAYALKALLEQGGYTSDYYVSSSDIIIETDQSMNQLLITYYSF